MTDTFTLDRREESISTTYEPTYREHVGALRAINGVLPRVLLIKRIGWGLIAAALAGVVLGAPGWLLVYLIFFPVVLFAVLGFLPIYMTWISRSQSPLTTTTTRVTVSERGVEHSAAGADGCITWPAIVRVAETRRFVLFFTGPQCAHYVPKSALTSAQLETVRRLSSRAAQPALPGEALDAARGRELDRRPDEIAFARFEWNAGQLYRVTRLTTRYGYRQWPIYLWMLALGAWSGGPTLYRQWAEGGLGNVSLSLLLLSLFPLMLVMAIGPILAWWYSRRGLRSYPAANGPITVAVGPAALRCAGTLSIGEIPWPALVKAVETEEFFLFFATKLQAIHLPKAALDAPAVAAVRELLERQQGKRFRQRR